MQVKLFPFQRSILKAINDHKFTTVCVGRRCGKSYVGALAAVLHCLKKEYRRVLIVAPTSEMAAQTYWDQLQDFVRDLNPPVTVKQQEKNMEFHNGSVINLRSADKPDRLRGISGRAAVSLIISDETAFYRTADGESLFYDVLLPYTLNEKADCRFVAISTPMGTQGIFYDLFQKGLDENEPLFHSVKFSAYDARPDMKEAFDALKETLPEKRFESEVMASFVGSGHDVFHNFDPSLNIDHTVKGIEKDEPVILGFDQNVGINFTNIARIKTINGRQVIEIIEEIQDKYKDIPSFIAGINERFKGHYITICPDATISAKSATAGIGKSTLEQFKSAGWHVKMDKKNPIIIDSINVVNDFLLDPMGNRNLRIHPQCKRTIAALSTTAWDDKFVDGNKIKKGTYDKYAHALDGLRYLCWQYRKRTKPGTIRGFMF